MVEPLYHFLPRVLQPDNSFLSPDDDGYPLWLETMNAVDDSIERGVNESYWLGFDDTMHVAPLTRPSYDKITSTVLACDAAFAFFDRALVARSMRPPSLRDSLEQRRPLLEWWLGGRICTIGRAKYLQGRRDLFHDDYEGARRCARQLRSAGLQFLNAGQHEVYMGGQEYCRYAILLLHEIWGRRSRSALSAADVIRLVLSTCSFRCFLRAMVAPQAQWAMECLARLSERNPLDDTLRQLTLAFREQREMDDLEASAAPPVLPTSIDAEAVGQLRPDRVVPAPSDRYLDVARIATLIASTTRQCIEQFKRGAFAGEVGTRPPAALSVRGSSIEDDRIGMAFVGTFAAGMEQWLTSYAWRWYQPRIQCLRVCRDIIDRVS